MTIESEKELYLEGIRLFNTHEFFEAHEKWEDVWRATSGVKRSFYHGLIQCAVALEHYRRSNPRGVASLFASYQPKFKDLPDPFMGLQVGEFLRKMRGALSPVIDSPRKLEKGEIELDESRVPMIVLVYDPFESGEAEGLNRPEKY